MWAVPQVYGGPSGERGRVRTLFPVLKGAPDDGMRGEKTMILDKKMQVFLAVATNRSFSETARQLSMSQSVVSFHVDSLEKELGVSLFRRGGRTISLTREGEMLHREGKKIALSARRIEDAFSEHTEGLAHRIYLAGDALTCAFTLPWTLARFRERHPDVQFSYRHLDQDTLLDMLVGRELDVALIGHHVQHRKLVSRSCFRDEIILVGPVSGAPGTLTRDGLKDLPLLWMTSDRGLDLLLRHELPEAGLHLKDLTIFMEVGDLTLAKMFARTGVGYVFLPRVSVDDELKAGHLREIPVEGLALERMTYLVSRREKQLREAVQRFLSFMDERIRAGQDIGSIRFDGLKSPL